MHFITEEEFIWIMNSYFRHKKRLNAGFVSSSDDN